jgi:hypothetical protein
MYRQLRSAPQGNEVKPRCAAALALTLLPACAGPSVKTAQSTGWQIMRPPQIAGTLDETAPLSKWVVAPAAIDAYPSQGECEQMIENWREESGREDFQRAAKNDDMLRCVSTNDPRLKEK